MFYILPYTIFYAIFFPSFFILFASLGQQTPAAFIPSISFFLVLHFFSAYILITSTNHHQIFPLLQQASASSHFFCNKKALAFTSACLANPVDYDTMDGCTRLGAGMGAMHTVSYLNQTSLGQNQGYHKRKFSRNCFCPYESLPVYRMVPSAHNATTLGPSA